MPADNEHLDIPTLETWLWDAACVVRGAADAPKFKDFILPLVFYKRLSDIFDDEYARLTKEYGDDEAAWDIIRADHEDALKHGHPGIVRFFLPRECAWSKLRYHPADRKLGKFITTVMQVDFSACG
ncbi:MAG: type I restriction-modification system subunit M N-terminal domain-containing protein [Ktedonobacteraceae bacterium]|nr:type I restriction-modification system subunit M N-terminal domain-containing protein [Ktedonobacteraceae bacterium]MBA3822469.1 type I restriction-modification system subunit M N-terminal domain-containing protein [Ktedonobacterales bacterium]